MKKIILLKKLSLNLLVLIAIVFQSLLQSDAAFACHNFSVPSTGMSTVDESDPCLPTLTITNICIQDDGGNSLPCTTWDANVNMEYTYTPTDAACSPGATTSNNPTDDAFNGTIVLDGGLDCFDLPDVVTFCPGQTSTITVDVYRTDTGGSLGSIDYTDSPSTTAAPLDPAFTLSAEVICIGETVDLTAVDTRCNMFTGTGVAGNVFTGSAAGCFQVTNVLAAGSPCETTCSKFITVLEPTAPAAAPAVEICASDAPATINAMCADCSPGAPCADSAASTTWFDAPTGGNMIGSGAALIAPDTAPGTYTYYAECSCGPTPCISGRTPYSLVIAAEPTVTLVKTKCDGNPDGDLDPTNDTDEYTYEVIVSFSTDPGTSTLSVDVAGLGTASISTVAGQLQYVFSSDPAHPTADDTSLPIIPVTTAGTVTASVTIGALTCSADFALEAEDDCSCFRRYCDDTMDTGDAITLGPDGTLPNPGANPAYQTNYILVDPATGSILQTDDDGDLNISFDLTSVPSGTLCQVYAVNFDANDPAAAAYVAGAGTLASLCYIDDPCLCIDVSCSACYILKLPQPEPGTCDGPDFACAGNPPVSQELALVATCADCPAEYQIGNGGVAPAVEYAWYDAATGGNLLATTATYDPTVDPVGDSGFDVNTPGNYVFYSSCICEGCESERTACQVVINEQPEPPMCGNNPTEFCEGADIPDFTFVTSSTGANGSDFTIYDVAGTILAGPTNANPAVSFDIEAALGAAIPGGLAPGQYQFLVTETIAAGGNDDNGNPLLCESAPAFCGFNIIPASDPSWEASFLCCTADPVLLYAGPNAAGCPAATLESIGGQTPVNSGTADFDPFAYFTGDGVYYNDGGTPADPLDDCWYFDPSIGQPGQTTGPLGGTGTPVLSEGEISVIFFTGEQPCQGSQLNDFYVFCEVDATLEPFTACKCGCGQFDLEVLWGSNTTPGGIWMLDPACSPNPDPANPSIMVQADVLTYDPATITDATTICVLYSVGSAEAGGDCVDIGTTTITIQPTPSVDFDLPDGPLCTTNADISVAAYLTGENIANGEIIFTQLTDFAGNPVAAPVTTTGADFTIAVSTLPAGDYSVSYTETISNAPDPDCVSTQTEYFSILPGGDPTWTNPSPVCLTAVPLTLSPDNAPIPGTPGSWSGPGITDMVDVVAGTYDATFNPMAPGVYTVTFCIGDGICQECLTQAVEVFPEVEGELVVDDIVCAASTNCYDLEQQYISDNSSATGANTTLGGIWLNPIVVSGPGTVSLNGNNVCYDPATITAATTISVDYSVASYTGAVPNCVDMGTTTITIVPQPAVDMDLPSSWCTDETVNLFDYIVDPSTGDVVDPGDIDAATSFTTSDPAVTVAADGSVDFGGFTGAIEICYTETASGTSSSGEALDCTDTDCDIVDIYDISGELGDDQSVCLASNNCFDLEGFFTPNTTQGGIFFPTMNPLPDGFVINGNSICYDPADITDPTSVTVTYSVQAGPTGVGTTCIRMDEATITIVPQPEIDIDVPGSACNLEMLDLDNYIVSPSGGVDPNLNPDVSWTLGGIIPEANSVDNGSGTTIDGNNVLQIPPDFTGQIEVCYGEEEVDDVDPVEPGDPTTCSAIDCDIIYITSVYADLGEDVSTCLSSSNCFDLEQLWINDGSIPNNNNTTQGGIWIPTPGTSLPGDVVINGNNLCYEPGVITDITAVELTYSVAANPSGLGTTCIKLDDAVVTLVPTPDPYFAGEQDVCATDPGWSMEVLDDDYADNSWYADSGNWTVVGSGVGNAGVDGIGAGIFTPNGNSLDSDPQPTIADPSLAGQYTITFNVTSTDGVVDCSDEIITTVNILPSYDACFDAPQEICESVGAFVLFADEDVFTDFTNNDFFGQLESEISVWNYIDANGQSQTLTLVGDGTGDAYFDPSAVGPGTYTISHYLGYDGCQTTCVATIVVKPDVDASIMDNTVCSSISQNIDLSILFTSNTTGGGTFTLVPDANGCVGTAVDPNGNIICLTANDVAVQADGSSLFYNSQLIDDYNDIQIFVQYEVGNPACCMWAAGGIGEMCTADAMDDCYGVATATLYIAGGHDVFLDFPEEPYCSDVDPLCIYDYSSIEDQSLPGVIVNTDGILEPGEVEFEVVAVNGSYHPDSLFVDVNNNGGVYEPGIDFYYPDVIDYSACADESGGAGNYTCDCAVVNLEGVPKEVTLTIRFTYYDWVDGNGNGVVDPGEGCIAMAEDNIFVLPAGNAAMMEDQICESDCALDLISLFYINDPEFGTTTVCGDFYIQCPEDVSLGTVMDPNDTNGNGSFDPADDSYPVYDFCWLDDPSKLYITYVVGNPLCTVDTGMTVVDICPQATAFADFEWGICNDGSTINLEDVAGLPADAAGSWTLGGAAVDVTALGCSDIADGQVYVYTAGNGGCCPDAAGAITIVGYSCPANDCVYFGDGETYSDYTADVLDAYYCTSDADFPTDQLNLRRVCPEVIEVGVLSSVDCEADPLTTQTVQTDLLNINIPAGTVYPYATIDDDWYVQLYYIKQRGFDCDDVTDPATVGTITDGQNDPSSDLLGGDHDGFNFQILNGAGVPFVNYSILDNYCPQDGAAATAGACAEDYNIDYYTYEELDNIATAAGTSLPYDPILGDILPGDNPINSQPGLLGEPCESGVEFGYNDYFILQFDAHDIYALAGGKEAFLDEFFGDNCNNASNLTFQLQSSLLGANVQLMMVMADMTIYNYKEDVAQYSALYCPESGNPDLGFSLTLQDVLCDEDPNAPTMLPSWLNESAVFNVTPVNYNVPVVDLNGNPSVATVNGMPMADLSGLVDIPTVGGSIPTCFDVSLDMSQLVPPACDLTNYVFDVCHEIETCGGSCDGDGIYQACQTIQIGRDHVPNSDEVEPMLAGCIEAGKVYFDDALLNCYFDPYGLPVGPNGAYPSDAANADAMDQCDIVGDWCVPAPFCDFVIQNGDEFAILETICEGLEAEFGPITGNDFGYVAPSSNGNDLVGLDNPNLPYPSELNNIKRLIIPVEYKFKVCETCPENTMIRYVQVVKQPEVTLNIPNSPGVCPEDATIICLDEACDWPTCNYQLTITNATTLDLVIPGELLDPCVTDATAPMGVQPGVDILLDYDCDNDPNTPSVTAIQVDWQVLTAPGGFFDQNGEQLFGNFSVELTVVCGTVESNCSDSDSQDLFFLGESNAVIADMTTCDQPVNLTGTFTNPGGSDLATTPGGIFYIDGGDGVYDAGAGDDTGVSGNEIQLATGTYTVWYVVGATTNCEEVGSATVTVLGNFAIFMDAPELCGNFTAINLSDIISIVDVVSGGSFTVDNLPAGTAGAFYEIVGGVATPITSPYTPSVNSGYVTIRYELDILDADGNVTCTAIEEEIISIFPEFDPCFGMTFADGSSATSSLCEDDGLIILTADPALAADQPNAYGIPVNEASVWVWVSTNGTTGTLISDASGNAAFDPAAAGPGTYVITHTIGYGSCTSVCTAIITVYPAVDPSINDLALGCGANPFGTISLSALTAGSTTAGGTFSSTTGAVFGGSVFLYTSPGCYEITYEVGNEGTDGACAATDNAYILVPEQPAPAFFIQDQACWSVNDALDTYNPIVFSPAYAGTLNTTWSVTGPATIDPATGQVTVTGVGTVTVTMTETVTTAGCGTLADVACSSSYTQTMIVENGTAQNAEFAADLYPCVGDVVDLTATTAGGIFTGINVTDNGDGQTGTFTATASGDYVVTYTLNSSNGCTSVYSVIISVDEVPPTIHCPNNITVVADPGQCTAAVSIADPMPMDNCQVVSYSNDYNNTTDASDTYPIGTTTVTWTATDNAGNTVTCSFNVTVVDNIAPTVTCPAETVINVCNPLLTPGPLTLADFNATDNCTTDLDFTYTTAVITQGPINTTIYTYVISDAAGNTVTCSQAINVSEYLQAPVISDPAPFCAGEMLPSIKGGGDNYNFYADNNGSPGAFLSSCEGPGLSCSTSTWPIDTSVPGVYTVWVTQYVTNLDGTICESQASPINITILELPEANLSATGTTVCENDPINLMDFVDNQDGNWTGAGVFTSVDMGNGVSQIFSGVGLTDISPVKLYYTVSNGICEQSYLFVVTVNGDQSADWSPPGPFCDGSPSVDLNNFLIGTSGGSWSGDGINDAAIPTDADYGVFDAAGATGSFTVTYTTIAGTNLCEESQTHVIEVYEALDASWTNPGPVCTDDGAIDLMSLVTGTTGGTFSGEGVNNNMFYPSTVDNSGSVTYTVGSADCAVETTLSIQVIEMPWPPTVDGPGTICAANSLSEAVLEADAIYPFSYAWYTAATGGTSIATGTSYDMLGDVTGAGSYSYYVEAVTPSGCSSTRTEVTVTVLPAITTTNVTATCIPDGSDYVVTFDIAGASGSYFVNGALNTGSYTSNPIPGGTDYNFVVADAGGMCSSVSVSGSSIDCELPCSPIYTSEVDVNVACSGSTANFMVTLTDANADDQVITLDGPGLTTVVLSSVGNSQYSGSVSLVNTGCAPEMQTYTITGYCADGVTQVGFFNEDITVYPAEIESFISVTVSDDGCTATATVAAGCENFILADGSWSNSLAPGDTGTSTFGYTYFSSSVTTVGCFADAGSISVDHTCEDDYTPPVCDNEPGLMQTSQTYVCNGDGVIMAAAFANVNSSSVIGYVLHEGEFFDPSSSTILASSLSGMFSDPGITNTPLYISAVVGYADGSGFPDFAHPCTVWTPYGAYVIFLDPVAITVTSEDCAGDGTYTVTITVSGGVGNIAPNAAYLTVSDGTTTLTDVSAGDVLTFGPYNSGDAYAIEVLDAKSCTGGYTNIVDCGAGFKTTELSNNYGIAIYPNPTPGKFEVNCADCEEQPTTITLFNAAGEVIIAEADEVGADIYKQSFDLTEYPSGIYIIKAQYPSTDRYYKVIKE